jgi:hypothetical protein
LPLFSQYHPQFPNAFAVVVQSKRYLAAASVVDAKFVEEEHKKV